MTPSAPPADPRQPPFADADSHIERTLKVVVEYDGTDFSGWQRNPGVRTAQGELRAAVRTLTGEPELEVQGASRTDAGVHSLGQTASFVTHSRIPCGGFLRGLNSLLPPDLAVVRCEEEDADFHARYRSQGKLYRYVILNRPVRSPLMRTRAWHLRKPLDVEAMRSGASCLLGTHDFSAFRAAKCAAASPVTRLLRLDILTPRPGEVVVEVVGTSFLKYMVRNLVGTLTQVGLGRRPSGWIAEVLATRDRKQAGQTAPPQGLTLVRVFYDPDELALA